MTPLVMTRKNGSSLNMETILILYCIIKGYVPIKNSQNILGKGSCSFSCFNLYNLKFTKVFESPSSKFTFNSKKIIHEKVKWQNCRPG